MNVIYQQDTFKLDVDRITEHKHPVFGDVTVFHDVVIASEIVQPYKDGRAYKSRDELENYAWSVDGRWVIVGGHPEDGIISNRDQVAGRTVNPRYVKNLKDPKTQRPNRAGVRADVEIFNGRVKPKLLEDMKTGKKQDVSIGFFFSKDDTPGKVEDGPCKDEEYDYVQRNMFHDHLAAGIDNGRCTMPFCGLGADEIVKNMANDPFAGFQSFNECVSKIMGENPDMSEESAIKICGSLKAKHEDAISESASRNIRALAKVILEECDKEEHEQAVLSGNANLKDAVLKSMSKQIDEKIAEILRDI